ncbi:MAG: hypothetical protein IJG13_00265 [Kiritimatiellae bacterium]|nr:hypothetical protein [Kiritimatiellia bacterium]MBQ6329165.1 hypothetical protein [Kiritimatiellia bacterium]
MKKMVVAAALVAAGCAFAQQSEIAKWDPRMAADKAVVDTNGVKWVDGKYLPIEGRWTLGDTEHYYMRLPDTLTTNVNAGVRGMRSHTSGMLFRFRTDSGFLVIRHKPLNGWHAMPHMTEVGTSGWDVYKLDKASGKWRFVASNHGAAADKADPGARVKRIAWSAGDECIINLPLYNGVKEFSLGIAPGAKIEAPAPWASGVSKPVVFYGTSITHGGCSTRPGLGFVNIVGRDLQVPVYGLGFSGSGVMEYELSDVISKIDASCYVLDCLWNMRSDPTAQNPRSVERNYEKFIRNLRAKRPGVPIVMAEACDVFMRGPKGKDKFTRRLYEKLVAEGWKDLVYLHKDEMYTGDTEGTVDGCHPNDLGMMSMAKAFGKAVREALKLK